MRKRKSTDPAQKMYFTDETQNAIIRYNESDDPEVREQIYREFIEYPFDKLAENIINRFKFPYINYSFDDIKKQVVSFLCIHLSKYTKDKGKAFSYFSVIAKNYLILHNNNGYKNEKRSVSLFGDIDEHASPTDLPIEETLVLNAPDTQNQEEMKEFVKLMITYWEHNVTKYFKKKRDIEIANAVIELFKRVDTMENFNKKAVYLMIREMTDCKTSYITKVLGKMKLHITKQLNDYREYGIINDPTSKFFTYR
jgi:hypothetical protein